MFSMLPAAGRVLAGTHSTMTRFLWARAELSRGGLNWLLDSENSVWFMRARLLSLRSCTMITFDWSGLWYTASWSLHFYCGDINTPFGSSICASNTALRVRLVNVYLGSSISGVVFHTMPSPTGLAGPTLTGNHMSSLDAPNTCAMFCALEMKYGESNG